MLPQDEGFDGGGEMRELLPPGKGFDAANGLGRKRYELARLAESGPSGTGACPAMRDDGAGGIEVIQHGASGCEAGLKVHGVRGAFSA